MSPACNQCRSHLQIITQDVHVDICGKMPSPSEKDICVTSHGLFSPPKTHKQLEYTDMKEHMWKPRCEMLELCDQGGLENVQKIGVQLLNFHRLHKLKMLAPISQSIQ